MPGKTFKLWGRERCLDRPPLPIPLKASQQLLLALYIANAHEGFPDDSAVKTPPASAGDARDSGSIPGLGRSPGVGNGNLLQYSCLENSMDKGAWWATVQGSQQVRYN